METGTVTPLDPMRLKREAIRLVLAGLAIFGLFLYQSLLYRSGGVANITLICNHTVSVAFVAIVYLAAPEKK